MEELNFEENYDAQQEVRRLKCEAVVRVNDGSLLDTPVSLSSDKSLTNLNYFTFLTLITLFKILHLDNS